MWKKTRALLRIIYIIRKSHIKASPLIKFNRKIENKRKRIIMIFIRAISLKFVQISRNLYLKKILRRESMLDIPHGKSPALARHVPYGRIKIEPSNYWWQHTPKSFLIFKLFERTVRCFLTIYYLASHFILGNNQVFGNGLLRLFLVRHVFSTLHLWSRDFRSSCIIWISICSRRHCMLL